MKEEDKQKEYDEFLDIIYHQLERTLERRPKNPVTAFAKKILQEVNLDSDGEEIKEKKKKDKKKEKKEKQEQEELERPESPEEAPYELYRHQRSKKNEDEDYEGNESEEESYISESDIEQNDFEEEIMKSTIFLALGLSSILAYPNNPPIPGRRSGYTYGTAKCGVEFEIFYDLLCVDSQDADPIFQEFLKKPFLSSTVGDQISVTYTFFPLPYHHEVWIPHKLVPYFEDMCRTDVTKCKYYEYANFTLINQNDLLNAKGTSENEIIKMWTQKVATQFSLNQQELLDVYQKNTNNAEQRLRYMWKYAAAKQVTGTPRVFVNGIHVETFPSDTDEWMQLLKDTYESQYPKKSESQEL